MEPSALEPGEIVNRQYRVIELLDQRNDVELYSAEEATSNQLVWLKALSSRGVNDLSAMQKLQDEARVLSRFKHKNVIAVYDFVTAESRTAFLVEEHLDGKSLREVLNEDGHLSFERALPIFMQLCDGLKAAHAAGFVHRKFDPASVFLIHEDEKSIVAKIIDFSDAKLLDDDLNERLHDVFITVPDKQACYYSPEQILNREVGFAADVFGMAVFIYEVLLGRAAFSGAELKDILRENAIFRMSKFEEFRDSSVFPQGLAQVILKGMEIDPRDRYQSIDEFKNALVFTIGGDSLLKAEQMLIQLKEWLKKRLRYKYHTHSNRFKI